MGNRYNDRSHQTEADLNHARNTLEDTGFEWSCFAAHQAAEKALKAVFLKNGIDAGSHTITTLMGRFPENLQQPVEELVNSARVLDKHYIPTRYPYGFPSGTPKDFYPESEAQ